MSIEPEVLDMARKQAVAIRDKQELPYKPPYLKKDGTEIDTAWFDTFARNFFGRPDLLKNELPKTNWH